jgi:hypothetical protein
MSVVIAALAGPSDDRAAVQNDDPVRKGCCQVEVMQHSHDSRSTSRP